MKTWKLIQFLERRGSINYYIYQCPTCGNEYAKNKSEVKLYRECKNCANKNNNNKNKSRNSIYTRETANKNRKYNLPKNIEIFIKNERYIRYCASFMINGKRWRSHTTNNLKTAILYKKQKLNDIINKKPV